MTLGRGRKCLEAVEHAGVAWRGGEGSAGEARVEQSLELCLPDIDEIGATSGQLRSNVLISWVFLSGTAVVFRP
jgi:hypothetical protein